VGGNGISRIPLEKGAEDFGNADRGDRKVVRFQPQDRKADQRGEERRGEAGAQERHVDPGVKLEGAGIILVNLLREFDLDRHGEDRVGVRADEHEAGLPKGEQAGKAVQQVHGNGYQRIDGALFEYGEDDAGRVDRLLQYQNGDIDQRDRAESEPKLEFAFIFHTVLLPKPCPWLFRRTSR
jgi:hypothetical protein